MTLTTYEAYFQTLASGALFGHTAQVPRFGMVSATEIEEGLKSTLNMADGFCLLLEKYEGSLSVNQSGHGQKIKIGGVLILKEVGRGDSTTIKDIQQAAEALAEKLWAKLLYDLDQYTQNPAIPFALRNLDRTPIAFQFVEDLFDNAAGIRLEFTTRNRLSFTTLHNPADWTITP